MTNVRAGICEHIMSLYIDMKMILPSNCSYCGSCCARGVFRHSAGLHARVILDGATCQPRELGDVRDVLSVLVVV